MWSCGPGPATPSSSTATGCCGGPATRWTGPSPGCTRPPPQSPGAAWEDPGAVADHILTTLLPEGLDDEESEEDVVLLAVRFD